LGYNLPSSSAGFRAESRNNESSDAELECFTHQIQDNLVPNEHERAFGYHRQLRHAGVNVLTKNRIPGWMNQVRLVSTRDCLSNHGGSPCIGANDNYRIWINQSLNVAMRDALGCRQQGLNFAHVPP
jgi:hypothetical protein